MSFFDILFTVFIKPLELMFEFIFAIANSVVPNPGANIIITSLAVNFLILPLYRRADVIQQQAREREKELRPMADHIKKYFKGDERVMIMQTFYKQEHYSPLSSMKSLISLLLQIPFFIAAYQFLSHLPLLNGVSLGPISDLAKPDALLTIGGITLNVLPIMMTLINIVSSEIYTHGQPFKDKIVLYISAAIFLVLLYNSPSGLVFYWTLNNLFSLLKNVFYKLKNPGFVFKWVCAAAGIAGTAALFIYKAKLGNRKFGFLLLLCIALIVPIVVHFLPFGKDKKKEPKPLTRGDKLLYLFGSLFMTFFTGFLIPSTVVSSSPGDFMFLAKLEDPSYYIWYTLCIGTGVFFVWLGIFYLLASDKAKRLFGIILLAVSGIATADYLFFGTNLGTLSAELELDDGLKYTTQTVIINLVVIAGVTAVLLLMNRFIPGITRFIVITAAVASFGMGIYNVYRTGVEYREYCKNARITESPQITLSRNGNNVMVIMLDRAIGCLPPYLFNENKILKKQYDGFVCYTRTLSFGSHTNFAAPALFGGYEYTPEELNKRDNVLLKDKHNEALLMMPVLFSTNGYKTTVIDPPYSNYSTLCDLSIFDGYDNIDAYVATGVSYDYKDEILIQSVSVRERNFFLYSMFKTAPVIAQPSIYNNGKYHSLNVKYYSDTDVHYHYPQWRENLSISHGIRAPFMNSYSVLEKMQSFTQITDTDQNTFLMMDNDTAHYPVLLQADKGFVPQEDVDNTKYDMIYSSKVYDGVPLRYLEYDQVSHYHCNMAAYKRLGEWFDYLKQQGVWDNTRIIIVADHGYNVGYLDDMVFEDLGLDATFLNPVLMIKDFGSTGEPEFRQDFMTNADVPTMALDGLIKDPVNPFTGNAINNNAKFEQDQHIIMSSVWKVTENNGFKFQPGKWYSVHDSIDNRLNWKYLGEY